MSNSMLTGSGMVIPAKLASAKCISVFVFCLVYLFVFVLFLLFV